MNNIMSMQNKPTLIMVAHRLSTLEVCDRVFARQGKLFNKENWMKSKQHYP